MKLMISKQEFYQAIDALSQYKITTSELGRLAGKRPRSIAELSYRRVGSALLKSYLPIPIMEYRTRGFRYSNKIGYPVQVPSIDPIHIGTVELYRLMEKHGIDSNKYPFQRFFLWTLLDVNDNVHYFLHFQYATGRIADIFEIQLKREYRDNFSVDVSGRKRLRYFQQWLELTPLSS